MKLKEPIIVNHGGGKTDYLDKWLKENKNHLIATMIEDNPDQKVVMALGQAIELEKSKYPDFDDKKHYIHVEITHNKDQQALKIFAQKRDKK